MQQKNDTKVDWRPRHIEQRAEAWTAKELPQGFEIAQRLNLHVRGGPHRLLDHCCKKGCVYPLVDSASDPDCYP
jgi:hypothetical protein